MSDQNTPLFSILSENISPQKPEQKENLDPKQDPNSALNNLEIEREKIKAQIQSEMQKAQSEIQKNQNNSDNPPAILEPNNVTQFNKTMSASDIISRIKQKQKYEEVILPSRCLGYDFIEKDTPVKVRPMTIAEEKLLATPRLVKSGQAIDKIFESCLYENIDPSQLFSVDRTYLLFYIRGISYGPLYEVSLQCPSCDMQFEDEINLDDLSLTRAEDSFEDSIHTVLPDSGLNVWYRLSRGTDEKTLTKYRESMIKGFGALAVDDTLIRRNIILIHKIEHLESKKDIEQIVNSLSVKDSNFLREQFRKPPFGLDTEISMTCPYCYHEWVLEVPIDANFFFPSIKKAAS